MNSEILKSIEKRDIELKLMVLEPHGLLDKYCTSIRDIYEYRSTLKQLPYEEWIVEKIAKIIVSSIRGQKRFRQLDCLKVLRAIVKDNNCPPLSEKTVSLLFEIYKHYIFHKNENIQWCVSSLLRKRNLAQVEIQWLIDHWKTSKHLVNRLLRYPSFNEEIAKWAKERYNKGDFPERTSEVIAYFIEDQFLELCEKESLSSIVWGIYYARLSTDKKDFLLNQLAISHFATEIMEVCLRLKLTNPLKTMIKNQSNNLLNYNY